jgi:hypothetical protein
MRRFVVILVCALAAVPAAYAAARATGDGVLELKSVYGTVGVGREGVPARGILWGQMDYGKLTVVDPVVGDGTILVTGWENRKLTPAGDDGSPAISVYSGSNLHFRVTGGKYRLFFNGSGIDLTAIGVGTAYLKGDPLVYDTGDYAVNSGKWLPVPVPDPVAPKALAVPFGTPASQPPQAP